MYFYEVTHADLINALDWLNEYWGGNIQFSIFDQRFDENNVPRWRATLRVRDTGGPGHSISRPARMMFGTRTPTACWHVHKCLFLEMPDTAIVFNGVHWLKRSEDEWYEYYKRSFLITELCECDHTMREYRQRSRFLANLHAPAPREINIQSLPPVPIEEDITPLNVSPVSEDADVNILEEDGKIKTSHHWKEYLPKRTKNHKLIWRIFK